MSNFTFTGQFQTHETVAVVYDATWAGLRYPRRHWLAWWGATVFGPLLMAVFNFKTLKFGVTRGGRFKFVEWTWR